MGLSRTITGLAEVRIHPSQFPQAVQFDLFDSLRSRKINHKFHYDNIKQAQKWLALHEACSPARTDPDCQATYERGFAAVTQRVSGSRVHVIGLGCGGGQKDTALLNLLQSPGRELFYTPCDVSVAMVLVARQTALQVVAYENCFPLVCDLASAADLSAAVLTPERDLNTSSRGNRSRVLTFFGMLPNFEPEIILPKLAALVQAGDYLLLSANLAPGKDYTAGVKHVLPLYDNELTQDWLLSFLLDLGIEKSDGDLRFIVEDSPGPVPLKRIAAYFHFRRALAIRVHNEHFEFNPETPLRLFFSYRHTPALVRQMLAQYGMELVGEWVTASEEEGVFLAMKRSIT